MGNFKRGVISNKGLMATLCILIVMIAGLVTGIIIINLNVNSDTNDDGISYEIFDQSKIREEAERIYNNNPENASKTIDYYVNLANTEPIDENRVNAVAWNLYSFFMNEKIGDKESALDGLLLMDISIVNDLDKYMWYSIIVTLATELEHEDIKLTYEPLKDALQPARDEYLKKTDEFVEYTEWWVKEQAETNKDEIDAYWERMANEKNEEDI